MFELAQSALNLVKGMDFATDSADHRTRRAMEREIEIIGEAARRVSDGFKELHPDVPWEKIVRQRHRLTHDYAAIQDELIWRVLTTHLPELVEVLRDLPPPDEVES